MGKSIFSKLFSRARKDLFFAWQVELTTRCPLRCRMCIRDSSADWNTRDMPIDDFKKVAPYFRNIENVVLEGWGEPLLYKDLIDAVKIVKEAGSQAGFVTSGWGLNREYIIDLIKAGVDFIGFSLAGATSETHKAIRINSDFERILQSIQEFNKFKTDHNLEKPRLHIVFLLLRDNLLEISSLLDLAKEVGIRVIVMINLVQVTNEWQNSQKVFIYGEEENKSVFQEAEIKAKELGIMLKKPSLSPKTVGLCEEDPLKNLYISVDGQVAPCVYLYPPTSSPMTRIFCDHEHSIEKVSFGNIFTEPLDRIWNSTNYVAFREGLSVRKRSFEKGSSFTASIALDTESLKRSARAELPEFPEPRQTCHRMLGM
jgi:MoaA/NifB/PqqE/SkfB family radical SAM enzyme